MSGGAFEGIQYKIKDTLSGQMGDPELDEMVEDFIELVYCLDYWQSGDTSEESFRESVREFKLKWFGPNERPERLRRMIVEKCAKLKSELLMVVG